MDAQQQSTHTHADKPVSDLDAWLRRHMGRPLAVAIVSTDPLDDNVQRLASALAGYAEIRVLVPEPGEELSGFLDTLPRADPKIVLVETSTLAGDEQQARATLDELESHGILDRAFVALIGPHVTRDAARRLGFEDGFAAQADPAELTATLAREGVAVDERRRRGSSPPCYL